MVAVASPNWLNLLGLLCMLFGLIFLGDAIGSDGARWSDGNARDAGLRGYQRVALSMALGLLGIGLVLEMLGQFVIASMSVPIVLAMLALAFALLIFALLADLVGAKLDAANRPHATASRGETAAPVDIRDIEAHRNPERLRIAG